MHRLELHKPPKIVRMVNETERNNLSKRKIDREILHRLTNFPG
jgi:hypothetical protein